MWLGYANSYVNIDNHGAVVLLDALGSKARWKKISDIHDRLQWFNQWNELIQITESVTEDEFENFKVKVKSFSDTLLITFSHVHTDFGITKSELDKSYDLLCIASSYAGFFSSCALSMGIPFRGGISFGDFLEDNNSIMGDALIDAAEYYELPDWIGISLTPSAYKIIHLKKLLNTKIAKNFIDYDVPLKIGLEKDGVALNMIADYLKTKKTIFEPDSLYRKYEVTKKMDFSKSVDTLFRNMMYDTNNIEHTVKIRNTLTFLKHVESLKK